MKDVDALKNQMKVLHDLEDITKMLEQIAARDIATMRGDILGSRRYFREVWRVYKALKELMPPPPQVIRKHLVVAVGIDWGMPGDLLGKMLREAKRLQILHDSDMLLAGKKCHQRYKAKDGHTIHYFSVPKGATLKDIQPIYKVVAGYARVTFVYPSFESLSKQNITTASFNVDEDPQEDENTKLDDLKTVDVDRFIIDPDPQVLSDYLNEAIVGITVHHYFAEAMLAYSAAQMVAMRNGNNNAKDAGKDTRMKYHRARRAVIDAKIRELYGSRGAESNGA